MRIADILEYLDASEITYQFLGDEKTEINGFSSLVNYKPNTFCWIREVTNIPEEANLAEMALVFAKEKTDAMTNVIVTEEPRRLYFAVVEHFYGNRKTQETTIGEHTYLSPNVKLGKRVQIGNNCTLDGDITIGDDTVIRNNVTLEGKVTVGARCEIQSGCVIGYENVAYDEDAEHNKTVVRQYGGVQIGDDVYIQALVKIARGAIDNTIIESRSIIGDGSSISHNCHICENVAMLPFGILCGSVYVGKDSYISAAYIKNQIHIGENVFVGFGSVVVTDVADNEEVWGNPARKFKIKR